MNKVLIVLFAVLVISSSGKSFLDIFKKHKNNGGQVEFFLGFSSAFDLSDAAHSLLTCAGEDSSNFIKHLKLALQNLRDKKLNPAITEFLNVLNAIHELQADCPAGALPYVQKFGPAVIAWRANPALFYATVAKNFAAHPVDALKLSVRAFSDAKNGKNKEAGEDFGGLLKIALNSWLKSDLMLFAMNEEEETFLLQTETVSQKDALEFFFGFSSAFGLEEAADLLVYCSQDVPKLVSSIKTLIKDIKSANWNQALMDAIVAYSNIVQTRVECTGGVVPFVTKFGPVVAAFKQDKDAFLAKVGNNVKSNIPTLLVSSAKLVGDFKKNDYRSAGADFGSILQVTLNGML